MTLTTRFKKFSKNGNEMNYDSYITLTHLKYMEKNNLNHLWENLISVFAPNKYIKFTVYSIELMDNDFPIVYLSMLDKQMELKIANFIEDYGSNNDKFPIWRLEYCMTKININDIIVPQIVEIKELDNFLPIYQLEF